MTSHFKQGETVILKPNNRATGRTRNRIHEKGPSFIVEIEASMLNNTGSKIDGKISVCFRSMDGNWSGWIPADEILIVTSL